jgi:hypothetical protein
VETAVLLEDSNHGLKERDPTLSVGVGRRGHAKCRADGLERGDHDGVGDTVDKGAFDGAPIGKSDDSVGCGGDAGEVGGSVGSDIAVDDPDGVEPQADGERGEAGDCGCSPGTICGSGVDDRDAVRCGQRGLLGPTGGRGPWTWGCARSATGAAPTGGRGRGLMDPGGQRSWLSKPALGDRSGQALGNDVSPVTRLVPVVTNYSSPRYGGLLADAA